MITFEPCIDYDLLNWMDAATFTLDERPHYDSAEWMIGRDGDTLACFCAWKGVMHRDPDFVPYPVGFLYRAGVMEGFRGQGLQKHMVRLREDLMKKAGLPRSVTYTDADNAASMRSLIARGYLPYQPTEDTCLSGGLARLGRVGFVHWFRMLP